MIEGIDRMMTERRGFPQFKAFDTFLVHLYRNRKPGQTLADLYPQIIEWFEKNNAASRPSSDGNGPISHQQILRDLLKAVLV